MPITLWIAVEVNLFSGVDIIMKKSTPLLKYQELIAEVHRLFAEKQTGTIFITTSDNHLVRLVLNKGEIVHLVYDTNYRSYDAIPLLKKIQAGRLQFARGIFEAANEIPLPPTKELLYVLSGKGEEKNLLTYSPKKVDSPFEEVIIQIKRALSNHIGPIAALICDEYIEKTGGINNFNAIDALIDDVAKEIGEPDTERLFKIQLKDKIVKKNLI
ncbi:hypothetical protein THII_2623 [Thioploca ingrica]|uniref:DUF8082 domain-containing protein n=1 Tax=Thioploca ingrica TaxID=40754 RepID=A0A090ANH0_9GAMM|nr:hypothetical protein THII_2623 [Thioploca ingrica]